jgi:hypothetical protein
LSALPNDSIEDINESFLKFRKRSSMLAQDIAQVDLTQIEAHRDVPSPEDSNDYYPISIKSTNESRKQINVSICDVEATRFEFDDNYSYSDEGISDIAGEKFQSKTILQ